MSAHSQPSVGIDHPTVVPANFEAEDDADDHAGVADDERADDGRAER
ncbi:hypothetical protein [Halorubrum lacusprofundi]|jgi:hypothetical protein|uniref:Uncharacterized protein n=1 Tax=Halorubrum lacusprofundi (strain ATCC 49239 / DSM 5036 / JCM 8891 / ACAM 34) TaxID=416348 RepID=B9LS62_HALLT|nr:hypothetical protein [Halorubrum lacusprofundi]ACM55907.1 hypothetical protein Hlac_0303 [Halorubrum lacusprofundi ATCC 49239]MCG1006776.1 hypothetical protein [Halorubrum lacusprofundi]